MNLLLVSHLLPLRRPSVGGRPRASRHWPGFPGGQRQLPSAAAHPEPRHQAPSKAAPAPGRRSRDASPLAGLPSCGQRAQDCCPRGTTAPLPASSLGTQDWASGLRRRRRGPPGVGGLSVSLWEGGTWHKSHCKCQTATRPRRHSRERSPRGPGTRSLSSATGGVLEAGRAGTLAGPGFAEGRDLGRPRLPPRPSTWRTSLRPRGSKGPTLGGQTPKRRVAEDQRQGLAQVGSRTSWEPALLKAPGPALCTTGTAGPGPHSCSTETATRNGGFQALEGLGARGAGPASHPLPPAGAPTAQHRTHGLLGSSRPQPSLRTPEETTAEADVWTGKFPTKPRKPKPALFEGGNVAAKWGYSGTQALLDPGAHHGGARADGQDKTCQQMQKLLAIPSVLS